MLAGCGAEQTQSPAGPAGEPERDDVVTDVDGGALARDFADIERGQTSGYRLSDLAFLGDDLVIRDAGDWDAVWRAHKPHGDTPVVDFEAEMVLATFLGVQGTRCRGPATEIGHVRLEPGADGGRLVVEVVDSFREGNCRRRSSPYHFVRCRRFGGAVEFVHDPPRPVRRYETVDYGERSSYRFGDPGFEGEDLVIDSPALFEAFWRLHWADRHPMPPVPAIDFARQRVVVLLLGPQATSCGPRIVAEQVLFEADRVVVLALDDRVPGTCDGVSSPYHVIQIERTELAVVVEHRADEEPP